MAFTQAVWNMNVPIGGTRYRNYKPIRFPTGGGVIEFFRQRSDPGVESAIKEMSISWGRGGGGGVKGGGWVGGKPP